MPIVMPLSSVQIAAAVQLRDGYMAAWKSSGDVLDALRDSTPGFDPDSLWLKTAALNGLYGPLGLTAYGTLGNAVANAVAVMVASPDASVATVNAIAAIPDVGTRLAFASKFVHFFVPPYGAVPLWDSWARQRLNYHVAPPVSDDVTAENYAQFYVNAVQLQTAVNPLPSLRQLDYYLWLSAHWVAYMDDPEGFEGALKSFFSAPPPGALPLLTALRE